jgi:UDP-glucose 4-epimerase
MYAAAVPIFIRRMLDGKPATVYGDGSQTRDLIYIGDVVRANLIASEHPKAAGQVFNICTGVETRLLDLLDVMRGIFPDAPPAEFTAARMGDIHRSLGSPQKAKDLLGFSAQTSLADGLEETAPWMRAQSPVTSP